jgi:hypothetical protein
MPSVAVPHVMAERDPVGAPCHWIATTDTGRPHRTPLAVPVKHPDVPKKRRRCQMLSERF